MGDKKKKEKRGGGLFKVFAVLVLLVGGAGVALLQVAPEEFAARVDQVQALLRR